MEREVVRGYRFERRKVDPMEIRQRFIPSTEFSGFGFELSSCLLPASESAPGIYFCSRVSFNDFERRKQE